MRWHLASRTFLVAVADLVAHRIEGFHHRRTQGVVRGFGFHIRAGRDEVHGHAEGRAGFVPAFQKDMSFVDLELGREKPAPVSRGQSRKRRARGSGVSE